VCPVLCCCPASPLFLDSIFSFPGVKLTYDTDSPVIYGAPFPLSTGPTALPCFLFPSCLQGYQTRGQPHAVTRHLKLARDLPPSALSFLGAIPLSERVPKTFPTKSVSFPRPRLGLFLDPPKPLLGDQELTPKWKYQKLLKAFLHQQPSWIIYYSRSRLSREQQGSSILHPTPPQVPSIGIPALSSRASLERRLTRPRILLFSIEGFPTDRIESLWDGGHSLSTGDLPPRCNLRWFLFPTPNGTLLLPPPVKDAQVLTFDRSSAPSPTPFFFSLSRLGCLRSILV